MQNKPKTEKDTLIEEEAKISAPIANDHISTDDDQAGSYYYDDSHGYVTYDPDGDDDDEDEEEDDEDEGDQT